MNGDLATLGLILTIVLAIAAAMYVVLSRQRRCPGCSKAVVPGHTECPFCGSPYRAPPQPGSKTPPPQPASPSPSAVPQLIGVQGPLRGRTFPLISHQFTIGRSADNQLRIEGMLVSRHHAQISAQDSQYVLYDLESTNGTYVNGQRIARHPLRPGDRIQIGPSVFAFQTAEGVSPPRLVTPPPVQRTVAPAILPERVITVDALEDYVMMPIKRGGMATVYKGVSRRDNSTVAIKVLHQTDIYLRQKFEQEARIGQMLRHPHIAQIYQYGQRDGTFYIIMEYVDDGSLRDRLVPNQPLPLGSVVSVIGQTCEALSYAHKHGVVHRDIKPENILFSSIEGVKVVDFGIAKLTGKLTRTSDGMIVGTPFYMSYEQARGQPVGPWSDVYSLGIVLYEMVTGRVPFGGQPLQVVHKHLTENPIPPRKINPTLPSEIETVVVRAMAKDRRKRFHSVADLARALGYKGDVPSPGPYMIERREEKRSRISSWLRRPSRPLVPPPSAQLVVVAGPGRGRRIKLTPGVTVLRRRDIDPTDMLISREHARVIQQGDQFWLEDLNSTNGTYLNGQRIFTRMLLRSSDEVRIGNSVLRLQTG